jgi:hypothetical protein
MLVAIYVASFLLQSCSVFVVVSARKVRCARRLRGTLSFNIDEHPGENGKAAWYDEM